MDVPTAMLCFVLLNSLTSALFLSLGRRDHVGMENDVIVWDPGH